MSASRVAGARAAGLVGLGLHGVPDGSIAALAEHGRGGPPAWGVVGLYPSGQSFGDTDDFEMSTLSSATKISD